MKHVHISVNCRGNFPYKLITLNQDAQVFFKFVTLSVRNVSKEEGMGSITMGMLSLFGVTNIYTSH